MSRRVSSVLLKEKQSMKSYTLKVAEFWLRNQGGIVLEHFPNTYLYKGQYELSRFVPEPFPQVSWDGAPVKWVRVEENQGMLALTILKSRPRRLDGVMVVVRSTSVRRGGNDTEFNIRLCKIRHELKISARGNRNLLQAGYKHSEPATVMSLGSKLFCLGREGNLHVRFENPCNPNARIHTCKIQVDARLGVKAELTGKKPSERESASMKFPIPNRVTCAGLGMGAASIALETMFSGDENDADWGEG